MAGRDKKLLLIFYDLSYEDTRLYNLNNVFYIIFLYSVCQSVLGSRLFFSITCPQLNSYENKIGRLSSIELFSTTPGNFHLNQTMDKDLYILISVMN